jgi:hypothetical protein
VITPLAQVLIDNDYSIIEALKVLLKSEHFYDSDDMITENDNIGALIKSPVDLFTGLFRVFNIQVPDRETDTAAYYTDMGYLVSKLVDQGLNFYEPFEVAGYPAYHQTPGYNRNWITTYALAHRYQAAGILMKTFEQSTERSFQLDILDWVENSGQISDPSDSVEIVDVLLDSLFAVTLNQERYDYFLYTVFLDSPDTDQAYARGLWIQEWSNYLDAKPNSVETQLQKLLSALVETPEFQLY